MMISAEIKPKPNQANKAARALQEKGFQILHISKSISVQAPQNLWEATFQISFSKKTKIISNEASASDSFQEANKESMKIPVELEYLVEDLHFIEPPEFFSLNQH